MWVNMLMGKSTATKNTISSNSDNKKVATEDTTKPDVKDDAQKVNKNVPQPIPESGNSVIDDFNKIRSFTQKFTSAAEEKAAPLIQKGKAESAVIGASAGKVVDTSFIRKIIKILVVILAVMLIIYIAFKLFGNSNIKLPGITGQSTLTPSDSVSVTPFDLHQVTNSIYAKDPEVLKIEENIKVLHGELNNTELKDSSLNPPNVDFNVSF
jgi:hypothetical protein